MSKFLLTTYYNICQTLRGHKDLYKIRYEDGGDDDDDDKVEEDRGWREKTL